MNTYKQLLILGLALLWTQGCSGSGPVHFYQGEPRPVDELAHVVVPGPISVLEIDAKDADVPSQEDGVYHIYLLPGVHRIDFKYELYWGSEVSGYLVESDKYGIETRFEAGRTYQLRYPEAQDMWEAEDLVADFSATLVEKGTDRQIAARPVKELERRGVATTLVNPQTETAQKGTTPKPPANIDAQTASREDAVKRLKFWWLMADEAERQRFLQWQRSVEPQQGESTDQP